MSARSSDCARHLERERSPADGLGPAEQRGPGRPAAAVAGSAPASIRATRRTARRLEVAGHQVAVGHDGGRARVREDVGHLGRGQARVHRHRHAAGPVGGGVRDQPAQRQLGVQVDADPGAGLEAFVDQAARHGVGGAVPLGEGHGADVDDLEGGPVAELLGHAAQVLVHQHGCRSPQGDVGVRKLTPVSGSLQHGRCASGGQSRGCSQRDRSPGAAGRRGGPRKRQRVTTVRFDLPTPEGDTIEFWEAAREERLLIRHCLDCDAYSYYPRPFCPKCWSEQVEWYQASGTGTLYTWSVIYNNDQPPFRDRVPYVAAIVDLAEGPRMMTNVVDCPFDELQVGMAAEGDVPAHLRRVHDPRLRAGLRRTHHDRSHRRRHRRRRPHPHRARRAEPGRADPAGHRHADRGRRDLGAPASTPTTSTT